MNPNTSRQKPSGLICPQCNKFIPISIRDLLTKKGIECPYCSLQLSIDRGKSQKALSALAKIHQAEKSVENASKFEG